MNGHWKVYNIVVEMNFTEISVVSTEINVLDHLYNQVETVSEFYWIDQIWNSQ